MYGSMSLSPLGTRAARRSETLREAPSGSPARAGTRISVIGAVRRDRGGGQPRAHLARCRWIDALGTVPWGGKMSTSGFLSANGNGVSSVAGILIGVLA